MRIELHTVAVLWPLFKTAIYGRCSQVITFNPPVPPVLVFGPKMWKCSLCSLSKLTECKIENIPGSSLQGKSLQKFTKRKSFKSLTVTLLCLWAHRLQGWPYRFWYGGMAGGVDQGYDWPGLACYFHTGSIAPLESVGALKLTLF